MPVVSLVLGRRLNHSLALVTLGGDTSEGVRTLALDDESVRILDGQPQGEGYIP